MSNLRIIAKNHIPDASVVAVPSVLSTLPETNLLLPTEHGQTARSTSTAAQNFEFTWASPKIAGGVAVSRHNLTTSGTLRAEILGSGSPLLTDTGTTAAFSTAGLDTDVDDYTDASFRAWKNWVKYFTRQTGIYGMSLTATDASNPDGYLELTKVFMGPFFEVTYNPESLEITPPKSFISSRADDASQIVDTREDFTTITINLRALPNATDFATMIGIARLLGLGGECFLDPYPDNADAMGIYARGAYRLMAAPGFGHSDYGIHKNTMRFEST